MATIKEDYVSFKTAKLLDEKGFDIVTNYSYFIGSSDEYVCKYGDLIGHPAFKYDKFISAPTLQMACRWLREVHNLCVVVDRTACGYIYLITRIPSGTDIVGDDYNGDDEDSGQWTTWEGACEAGIMYCVKNLI